MKKYCPFWLLQQHKKQQVVVKIIIANYCIFGGVGMGGIAVERVKGKGERRELTLVLPFLRPGSNVELHMCQI